MPVEMVRVRVREERIERNYTPRWKFLGELERKSGP
jgi:hypothetical protein